MRIGLISDTHGDLDAWEKALKIFNNIDIAIHTGDILSSGPFNPRSPSYKPVELAEAINRAPFPIIFVRGNCDAEVDSIALDYPIQSPYSFISTNGLKIMATHGHLHDENKLIELGHRYKLNVVVSGHTHVEKIVKSAGLYLVNPGSASLPKGEEGLPTVGFIEDRYIKIVSLEDGTELEKVEIR
ncbi:MAG: phosphodiesterase [Actinobacteria bacterium]|nr:phosphodiesterase [Actinomycetota bacterium]